VRQRDRLKLQIVLADETLKFVRPFTRIDTDRRPGVFANDEASVLLERSDCERFDSHFK
jgi:hypothetical protein